jgi:crotonobetainyl-CoA:carnitine CoA-transferase CaiB-like acyl-CoA transferase
MMIDVAMLDCQVAITENALVRDELATDARFTTNDLRVTNQQVLKDELTKTLATKPAAEWIEMFHKAGVPCGPINEIAYTEGAVSR